MIFVGHHYAQTNTNNINKTCVLLQATGKDETNIGFMRKSKRTSQHETQNVKTHTRTTQKIKQMSNTDPTKQTKNRGSCQIIVYLFSFGNCIVCPSSIYGFGWHVWYQQTCLLVTDRVLFYFIIVCFSLRYNNVIVTAGTFEP